MRVERIEVPETTKVCTVHVRGPIGRKHDDDINDEDYA
jgi:hypothetical protein